MKDDAIDLRDIKERFLGTEPVGLRDRIVQSLDDAYRLGHGPLLDKNQEIRDECEAMRRKYDALVSALDEVRRQIAVNQK